MGKFIVALLAAFTLCIMAVHFIPAIGGFDPLVRLALGAAVLAGCYKLVA
jgi:hypothetical protein